MQLKSELTATIPEALAQYNKLPNITHSQIVKSTQTGSASHQPSAKNTKRSQRQKFLDSLALKYPDSGILQELAFMNAIEEQAAIEMLSCEPED